MTTISSSNNALSSLVSLYKKTDTAVSGNGQNSQTVTLSSGQVSTLENMIDANNSSSGSNLNSLLSGSTGSSDLNSIIDAIQARTTATTETALSKSSNTSSISTLTTANQEKAAEMMQSVFQTQQANLFTLLA